MNYYVDKRIFVTGKKSIIHMDNPFNLTEYIYSLVYSGGIAYADNGLHVESVLSGTGTQLNEVHLGGDLIENTSISGVTQTYNLRITELANFDIDNTNAINLEALIGFDLTSPALGIYTETQFIIQTPNVFNGIGTLNNGDILTLTNKTTGQSDFLPNKYTQSFLVSDWIGTNLTILASTHGRGINPIVQVVNDNTGYVVLPGNSLGIAGLWLNEIKISTIGDIVLTSGSSGNFDGRIMII